MLARRCFLAALAGVLLAHPAATRAQSARRIYRIGHLAASSPSPENTRLLGTFQLELRERGWIPVEVGLVESLARPGGNVTGVTFDVSPEQAAKLIELVAEIPGVVHLAVLWSRNYPAADRYRQALEHAAAARQRTIRFVEVSRPADFDGAFATLRRMPIDGLIVMTDQVAQVRGGDLVRFVAEQKLASVFGGPARRVVAAGGLLPWSADSAAYWRLAAVYADKILRGAAPATLPIEQPTTFELVINLRTAHALGLTIPQSLLLRADELIE